MTSALVHLAGVPVLACTPDGPTLDEGEALNLIAEASQHGAEVVSVPMQRCSGEFFTLASGLAGAVAQKFANYRLRLAILGDVSGHLAGSNALQAFVRETNRGNQLWFLPDQEHLVERLTRGKLTGGQPTGDQLTGDRLTGGG